MSKLTSFDSVTGHKNLISFLKRGVEEDNIPNVVIFHGNPGIGKSSIAKILAVEVATRWSDRALHDEYMQAIVEKNQSVDSVKLFNMSEIQRKEEEIQKVRAELNSNFTKTKRKVLILDEAHNMSNEAQDAILVELESLPEGVYVFLCTTEISSFRQALLSRGKATFRLNDLSDPEARKVVNEVIQERKLSFDVNKEMVVSLICDWANNQPRKMRNLLENFKEGSLVTSRDLEIFLNTSTAASIIELLKYLYGSMVLGIDYLNSIKYEESFVTMLIEVCKVAMGHTSKQISAKDTIYIKDFMKDKNPENIMQFTAEVSGLNVIRKRRVVSAFMKAHVQFKRTPPAQMSPNFKMNELETLRTTCEDANTIQVNNEIKGVQSLEELFSQSESF